MHDVHDTGFGRIMHIMQTMHFMQVMQNMQNYKIMHFMQIMQVMQNMQGYKIMQNMHFMQGSAFIILPQPLYFWDGLTAYFYSDKIGSSCWQLFISMK